MLYIPTEEELKWERRLLEEKMDLDKSGNNQFCHKWLHNLRSDKALSTGKSFIKGFIHNNSLRTV